MVFRFQRASCVAVGAFNIYIVQPKWLVAKSLIPEGIELTMESKLDEPGFRFNSESMDVKWIVTPTRIVIESEDANADCGTVMAKLLEWLPETPVSGVGNNTQYSVTLSEVQSQLNLPNFPVDSPLEGHEIQQRTFHAGLKVSGCLHNLQLSVKNTTCELMTNCHLATSPDTTVDFIKHARSFGEHRLLGTVLAKQYLKADIHV